MKKVIFITGISSGFGKITAELLSQKGHIVYGTIRSDSVVDTAINLLKMDLTDPNSIRNALDEVIRKEGRIDVLINNAGMHLGGPIEESPVDLFTRQMSTNFNGLVHVLQAFRGKCEICVIGLLDARMDIYSIFRDPRETSWPRRREVSAAGPRGDPIFTCLLREIGCLKNRLANSLIVRNNSTDTVLQAIT